jgi:hypothetical protein
LQSNYSSNVLIPQGDFYPIFRKAQHRQTQGNRAMIVAFVAMISPAENPIAFNISKDY